MAITDVIYILTNPSFPEFVKLGYAGNLERRLSELNRSASIPFAFRVYAVYKVDKPLTDKVLHSLIDRLNPDLRTIETFDGKERVKEFYEMSAEDAYGILECIAKISGTEDRLMRVKPEGHEIEDIKKAEEAVQTVRRGPFRFSMIGIKEGEVLEFIPDSSVKATVVDDRHISCGGIVTSLSRVAEDRLGIKAVQGPRYWKYNGRVLDDLRDEAETKAKQEGNS